MNKTHRWKCNVVVLTYQRYLRRFGDVSDFINGRESFWNGYGEVDFIETKEPKTKQNKKIKSYYSTPSSFEGRDEGSKRNLVDWRDLVNNVECLTLVVVIDIFFTDEIFHVHFPLHYYYSMYAKNNLSHTPLSLVRPY